MLEGGFDDSGFGVLLDAFAELTGCDKAALGQMVRVPGSDRLSPKQLLDRIAVQENAANAIQAAQARDLEAFARARLAQDRAEGCPQGLQGRTAPVEVGLACRVSTVSGQYRLYDATRAVQDHPQLLALVGTGAVSMAGLRRVLAVTEVLDPPLRRLVDAQLTEDATRSRLTPAKLEKAAQARALAADPAAAAKRVAKARATRRCVRLGDPDEGLAGIFAVLRAEEALAVFTKPDRTARGMRRDGDPRSIDTLMADAFTEWVTGTAMVVPDPPDQPAADRAESSVWRSTRGCPPWTWSVPPPRPAADPDPEDLAWDSYCDSDAPPGPDQRVARRSDGWPPGVDLFIPDPNGDTARDTACDAAGLDVHPAHGPPAHASVYPPARRLPGSVEVQVVISAATLLGLDDQPGMLRGYGAIPADVIADIVDTAESSGARTTLRGLLCDPVDGRLVAMESDARYFTGRLRDFGLFRDQDCRLTGGRIVDIDHVHDYQNGGATSASNGQGLGKLAHLLKDHPGMQVSALPRLVLGDGLDHLRSHAPDIGWTTPSGHTYRQSPPPALGHGTRPDESA